MSFDITCPWCGGRGRVLGARDAAWRFRLPCASCAKEMVVTWDGALSVGRVGGKLARSDEPTIPFQTLAAFSSRPSG